MSKATVQIMFMVAIVSVLATAIFGFSMMSKSGHTMAGCFGGTPGVLCSTLAPIEHFAAHIRTFQSISTAVVGIFSLVIATLALLFAVPLLKHKEKDKAPGERIVPGSQIDTGILRRSCMRWLALHEKRDPSFAFAASA